MISFVFQCSFGLDVFGYESLRSLPVYDASMLKGRGLRPPCPTVLQWSFNFGPFVYANCTART